MVLWIASETEAEIAKSFNDAASRLNYLVILRQIHPTKTDSMSFSGSKEVVVGHLEQVIVHFILPNNFQTSLGYSSWIMLRKEKSYMRTGRLQEMGASLSPAEAKFWLPLRLR